MKVVVILGEIMVIGEKHYKHTDEGPVKIVRRNRSPPNASRGTAEDGAGPSTNDNDGKSIVTGELAN